MARALLAALLLLSLAACGQGELAGPFADSRTPPVLGPRFFKPEGWAWGFVQAGKRPVQRYGVVTTWRAPRATVVVLPGYGESAEVWYETAGALTRRGYTVWVLDRAGQGGSARYTLPRDLGYTPTFDDDVATLKGLVRVVVRAPPGHPLILLGHGDGAVVAARAVETGLQVDSLILSSPDLAARAVPTDRAKGWIGKLMLVDRLPGPGWRPWSRSGPDARQSGQTHDVWRGGVGKAWQLANPDLRMSGPSLGWLAAHQAAAKAVQTDAARISIPVLMTLPGPASGQASRLCETVPQCAKVSLAGARPALHLESDTWRAPWFEAVTGFIAARAQLARDVVPPGGARPPADNTDVGEPKPGV